MQKRILFNNFSLKIAESYTPRFLNSKQYARMIDLWHLSRAGVDWKNGSDILYRRRLWVCKWMAKETPGISEMMVYKDLDGFLED